MGSRISSYSRLKKLILERTELIIEASKIKKEINTSFLGVIMSRVYHLAGDFYIYFLMNYHLREKKLKKKLFLILYRKKNNNIYKSSTGLCNVCVVHDFHP